jgi:hypothetical protein
MLKYTGENWRNIRFSVDVTGADFETAVPMFAPGEFRAHISKRQNGLCVVSASS